MNSIQLNMFDGKVCTKCKEWKPTQAFNPRSDNGKLRPWCVECSRKYKAELRNRARDKVNATRREYYNKNRAAILRQQKAAYDANPHKFRVRARMFSAAHPEYQTKGLDRLREWGKDNPIRRRLQAYTRRALLKSDVGKYNLSDWHCLCAWFGGCCLRCGEPKVTVDHVVPLSRGGANTIDNLQPLCDTCNKSKGIKATDYRDPVRLAAFLEHIRCLNPTEICRQSSPDIH